MEFKSHKKLFSINEFIEIYSISRSQFYLEKKHKRIKTVLLGTRTMIRAEDAEAWAAALVKVE